jgi:hypothetical protein
MAKIVLVMEGAVSREILLAKERVTIGRGPHNDIVIEDCAISAEHAVIVTENDDSFLEDLNSTNGTQVNGQPVRKHFLQDGDVIELAGHRMQYLATCRSSQELFDLCKSANRDEIVGEARGVASIRILNGPNAGKQALLISAFTTIGHPDSQVALIARHPHGYYLTHIEGEDYLSVNGKLLGADTLKMANGDVISLSGTYIQFLLYGNSAPS